MNKRDVSYCEDCLVVCGQDVYVYGGEIHYFRIPNELWLDRLLKAKRCFLNTIGAYVAWNWHEEKEGVFDFSGDHDLDRFLEICKELGLYVIVRPGPYICAEWDGGGFPAWIWTKKMAYRSTDPAFLGQISRWYDMICPIARRHLVTQGGSTILFQIENEYFWGNVPYLLRMAEIAKERGITVPIVHNVDRPLRGTNVIDSLDFYPSVWQIEGVQTGIDLLIEEQPGKPPIVMELEGGWFSVFGGSLPTARGSFPAEWTDILAKTCIAKGINGINFYMFHGGTNFGYWTAKGITTTYDCEAAVREWGELGERYWVVRLIGGFLKSFGNILVHCKPAEGLVESSNNNVDVFCREGERGSFIFVRNMGEDAGSVRLRTSLVEFGEIPVEGSIHLTPRSMLALPVNCYLRKPEATLAYSTSQVFLITEMKDRTVLVLYGSKGTQGELCLRLEEKPVVVGDIRHEWNSRHKVLRLNYVHPDTEKVFLVRLRAPLELIITNEERAARTWLPCFGDEEMPMVSNLYFLREWEVRDQSISLLAELEPQKRTEISIVVPRKVRDVMVNVRRIGFSHDKDTSILSFSLTTKESPNLVQNLNGTWKARAELLAKEVDYDHSQWQSWIPGMPLEALGYMKNGYSWYRCAFKAPQTMKNAVLSIPEIRDCGIVFVNGKFVGKGIGKISVDIGDTLKKDEENVLAICVESVGHCNIPCLTKDGNGILSPVYLSEEEKVELRDWKLRIASVEMKPGLPTSIDVSRMLMNNETPEEVLPITNDREWETLMISSPEELTKRFSAEADRLKILWLRAWVRIPKKHKGKSAVLSLKNMRPGTYKLYVNGAVRSFSSWTMSASGLAGTVDIDITESVKLGEPNLLALALYTMNALPTPLPRSFPELVIYGHRIEGDWKVTEGLHGEREKWFSPELDDSDWEEVQAFRLQKDLRSPFNGIIWYRKRFRLKGDPEYVAPLRLTLNEVKSKCLIYLNGHLVGRYADIGPQKDFYLPEPWLKQENVLASAVECFERDGMTGDIVVSPYYVREKAEIRIELG